MHFVEILSVNDTDQSSSATRSNLSYKNIAIHSCRIAKGSYKIFSIVLQLKFKMSDMNMYLNIIHIFDL